MNESAERAHSLGRRAEALARRELEARGFLVVGANVRTRSAEFDLIARDAAGLVFVEVKARTGTSAGQPYEAVGAERRQRMERAALEFLERAGADEDYRFGIVSVVAAADGTPVHVEWIDEA